MLEMLNNSNTLFLILAFLSGWAMGLLTLCVLVYNERKAAKALYRQYEMDLFANEEAIDQALRIANS